MGNHCCRNDIQANRDSQFEFFDCIYPQNKNLKILERKNSMARRAKIQISEEVKKKGINDEALKMLLADMDEQDQNL
jgi:hypothetical protein